MVLVQIWGVTPGKNNVNHKKWSRVEKGDVALFSRHGKIFAAATVIATLHSPRLARQLWGENQDGETWEYIYLLDEIRPLDIAYEAFNEVAGYKATAVIQGFNVLSEKKSEINAAHFDLLSDRYFPPVTQAQASAAVDELFAFTSLDTTISAKGRIEQRYLRQLLFGDAPTASCCICGEELPVALLVAAHIKDRSCCTLAERKDFTNIVAPMCKLGCDDLYERGYIGVDDNGGIIVNSKKSLTPHLRRVWLSTSADIATPGPLTAPSIFCENA